MISLKAHAVIDYLVGALFIISPYVFGFSEIRLARDVMVLLGAAVIAYSMITDYPYSIIKGLSVRVHLALDVIVGLFLMVAPSLYRYRYDLTNFQYFVHFIYGLGIIAVVSLTGRAPSATAIPVLPSEERKKSEPRKVA